MGLKQHVGLGQTVSLEVPTLPTDNLRSWVIAASLSHPPAQPQKNNMRERLTAGQVGVQPHLPRCSSSQICPTGHAESICGTSLEHLLWGPEWSVLLSLKSHLLHKAESESVSLSVVSDSLRPHGL